MRKQATGRKGLNCPKCFQMDNQKSQKVGTGTRHGNPEITSGLYCCFNVMETFLLEFLVLLPLDSVPYTVIKS